jgi:hypothetical protein
MMVFKAKFLSISVCLIILVIVAKGQSIDESRQPAIQFGRNVHVSSDAPTNPHAETFLALNSKNPEQMLATSIVFGDPLFPRGASRVYASVDSGRTWRRSSSLGPAVPPVTGTDPIVYYDQTGAALFGSITGGEFRVWRSTDGGFHFNSVAEVPGGLYDRQYLVVDTTLGPYAGRLYAAGQTTVRQTTGNRFPLLGITYSTDNGLTFLPTAFIDATLDGQPGGLGGIADLLVTSRGVVVVPFFGGPELKPSSLRQFWTLISENGGRTYSAPRPGLPMGRGPAGFRRIKTFSNLRATIDQSKGPFADRIYVTWVDYSDERYDVKISHSDDLGLTWSAPVKVNDNAGPNDPSNAAIVVNRDGVLAVIWNDRRDDPKNSCYRLYVSASLDGGETFLPNVQLNPHPTCTNAQGNWSMSIASNAGGINLSGVPDRFPNGGETQGLVAGPDGRFHVTWNNGESGVMQLWYSDFTVQLNGQTVGVRRVDRTKDITVEVDSPVIDFSAKSISFTVRLKNHSSTPIAAPLSLVVDNIDSGIQGVTATNADNGLTGKGATWTFLLKGRTNLAPNDASETRQLLWSFDGQMPAEPRLDPFRATFRIFGEPVKTPKRSESRK